MRNRYLYITLLAVLGFHGETLAQNAPRLVVNITIDQLRTDYLQAFEPLYGEDGFKRLLTKGRVYSNASYPFSPIDRASAWASIITGTTPYYHTIVGERWLNRETLRPVYCIGHNATPQALSTSTLGDELKVATDGKAMVCGIAPTADAAVLSAGHAADAAYWIDDNEGCWTSSTYYSSEVPAWLLSFNELYSPSKNISSTVWQPISELLGTFNFYMHTDAKQSFKHKFKGDNKYAQFKASGLVNNFITDMVCECIRSCGMGRDQVTDLMSVTYYAGNFDHKSMTECPLELQDTYYRLDRELGRLITSLERMLGKEQVLFVVTSTGYSDEESSDYAKYRIPTGTFYINRTAALLNMYFGAIWGQGKYVESTFRNQIFLNHKLLESRRVSLTDATLRAQEFLSQIQGVRNSYTSLQLQLSNGNNEQTLKLHHGFNPERCGDIIVEVSPGWRLLNEYTQENELSRASFTQFPIIFYGAGTEAERITDRVTIDRIAPTVAKSIRIRAPNACSSEPLF